MISDSISVCVIIVCLYMSMFMSVVSICCSFLYCPLGGAPFLGKPLPLAGPFPLVDCCSCGWYCN